MYLRIAGFLILCAALLVGVSCAKLGEPGAADVALARQELTKPDSIPAEWGKLVSVSSCPAFEKWVQLWFQDEEGVVRMVPYNVSSNYLAGQAHVIGRD